MDGWVIVGTKLDSKQLEKDLQREKRTLERYEKESEKLLTMKTKAEKDLEPYKQEIALLEQQVRGYEEMNISEKDRQQNIQRLQPQLDAINEKYAKQIGNYETINKKIQENAKNQSLVTNEIEETNKKLNRSKGIASLKDIMKDLNKETGSAIKKVGRWTLAVFGIRSAYMFVRQAMSTLSQYNEQIKNDVDYIRFAVASALQPLIQNLIKLAYTLLTYVNYIAQAWFGVDLFANASADAMSKSAKSAEKMKKSLAGFDEMNVISDSSSGGGTSASVPSLDLSAPEDVPIPSWLQWIVDNKDIVIAGLLGIAGGLTAVHLGLSLIQGLGIGLVLAGVALALQGIIDFIEEPSWHNFLTILEGISLVVAGIAVLMGGWVGALVAVGVAIVAYIIQNWDKVKEILGKVGTWIYEKVIKPVGDFFVKLWDGIKNGVKSAVDWVKEKFNAIVTFFSNLISKIVGLFKKIGTKVGDAIGSAFKTVINGVLKAIENILNFPIKSINKLIDVINEVPGIDLGRLPTFKLPRLKVGGIINMPGRGIPIGGAIGGESGAEGVIPLTDSQAMETLGQAIGKYVTINANITNTMNGRVISRELQKVNSSSDFAFNR